ncbi:MAG: biotin transporter BioY [Alphaproteobacteria bacterium]|nr:biotin transporter BioY [Alphaproteobacteria bacterium]
MTASTATASLPLLDRLWPADGRAATVLRAVGMACLGTALLTASARVQIPFWPVPMTMQTFVVLLLGLTCGARLGAGTVAFYLGLGAVGLPVFAGTPAKGIGLAYMTGPTGGYLVGFMAAVCVVGWLAARGWDRRVLTTLAAGVVGMVVIYALGAGYLASLYGAEKALATGVLPFLLGDALKIALLAATLQLVWRGIVRAP